MNHCPVTNDLHRYLADQDKAEARAEAIENLMHEDEAETYSDENIVMAIEAIQNDDVKWDEFCDALRNVNYNRLGVMLNNIIVNQAEARAVTKLERKAA